MVFIENFRFFYFLSKYLLEKSYLKKNTNLKNNNNNYYFFLIFSKMCLIELGGTFMSIYEKIAMGLRVCCIDVCNFVITVMKMMLINFIVTSDEDGFGCSTEGYW